jgi:LTXXQ motif family protein
MTHTPTRFLVASAALAAVLAQAQAADPHHPAGQAPGQAAAPQAAMPMAGADAQAGKPTAMGGGMGEMMEMVHPMMAGGGGMGMPFEHIEGRIAYLKAELGITEAQAAPWSAFADAMRADAAAMRAVHEGMAKGGMTKDAMPEALPNRLAAQRKMMTERAAMLGRMEAAATPLYAVLSADQRRVMDQAMPGPMGMM